MIGREEIADAAKRLSGVIRPTPTVPARALSEESGREVLAKPEHLQRTGSFKIRGAYNHISRYAEEPGATGVVAGSAGNHAQGVALAAALCGLGATIVMPESASLPKVQATRSYGAEVVLSGSSVDECIALAMHLAAERGAHYVPPFDDPLVIAGQGTIGLELLAEAPGLRTVVVPVGGGGLIAGIGVALKGADPSIRLVGVEAEGAASMCAALDAHAPVRLDTMATMADGIAVGCVADTTLAYVEHLVDEVVTVSDEEISRAILVLLERSKWVVEPAGAASAAAVLSGKVSGEGPVAVLLSGGNVDPLLLTRLVEHGLSAMGRYLILRVVLDDRPGSLSRLTAVLAELDLNVLGVEHHRSGAQVAIDEVEVILTLETRDPTHRERVLNELHQRNYAATVLG